jgi:hypothetical protein
MMTTSDLVAWQNANDAYLSAAVDWVRLLLSRHVPPPGAGGGVLSGARPQAGADAPPDDTVHPPWWKFRRTVITDQDPADVAGSTTPLLLSAPGYEVTQAEIDEAAERMRAAEAMDPPPALNVLARRLGLSAFERDVLLLSVAMELDTRVASLCARAQGSPSLAFPTFGLAFTLFEQPGWDARSPENPLRYWRLVELNQPWGQPLTSTALRTDERIVNYVKGLTHLDDRLAPFVSPLGDGADIDSFPPSQREVANAVLRALERDQPHLQPIQLLGRDPESKRLVARAVAQRLGLTIYRMAAELLPTQAADLETLVRLWQRETLLMPVALYVDASDVERTTESHAMPLRRVLARSGGVLFVEAREAWPIPQGSHTFDVEKPTAGEQRALWSAALGQEHEAEATELASQFRLGAASITRIAAEVTSGDSDQPLRERLWEKAGQQTRLRIDALAQRIDAKATWDDIVLPGAEAALLRQIAAHVDRRGTVYDEWGFRDRMNRGFGVSALFSGESGTGKTMAAEVIANELGRNLHRIDLSSVVSKWVGETEKNLPQLFNAADDASGILFFDEADALFGKRTEVQQSQDRFANIEINFLLQRLESYQGLAILATNMKSALDPAFLRRLRFIVNFPFPGPAERRAIWARAFPDKVPTEGLDFDRLAKLSLTGGSVHNVALAAAFMAAKQNPPVVTMPIVLEAAKTEMRKLEKPVHEADFRWNDKVVELTR